MIIGVDVCVCVCVCGGVVSPNQVWCNEMWFAKARSSLCMASWGINGFHLDKSSPGLFPMAFCWNFYFLTSFLRKFLLFTNSLYKSFTFSRTFLIFTFRSLLYMSLCGSRLCFANLYVSRLSNLHFIHLSLKISIFISSGNLYFSQLLNRSLLLTTLFYCKLLCGHFSSGAKLAAKPTSLKTCCAIAVQKQTYRGFANWNC